MTPTETAPSTTELTRERADLLESLARHRYFLRFTVSDLTDEQATLRPTASALCLGGLIKHVAETEKMWLDFAVGGGQAMAGGGNSEVDWNSRFDMAPGDTLAGVLEHYDEVARRTDELVATMDLDADHALPEAPWFEPGARWSVRRVVLHVIAETSQHAGHADIIRETLDGQKTMG
jgi:uncharacterized damage-inducible protein DinB